MSLESPQLPLKTNSLLLTPLNSLKMRSYAQMLCLFSDQLQMPGNENKDEICPGKLLRFSFVNYFWFNIYSWWIHLNTEDQIQFLDIIKNLFIKIPTTKKYFPWKMWRLVALKVKRKISVQGEHTVFVVILLSPEYACNNTHCIMMSS